MEELGPLLSFEKKPAGWGMQNGKPINPLPQTQGHRGVLMVSPPLTVTWTTRADKSTLLAVRFPITIWSDDDAMILPPDDGAGNAFYQDPVNLPGMHRDIFKKWAYYLLGELHSAQIPLTQQARTHVPKEYQGCDSSCGEEEDERSCSEEGEEDVMPPVMDSSDEDGAHLNKWMPMSDSSDEDGAHLNSPYRSSDRRAAGRNRRSTSN